MEPDFSGYATKANLKCSDGRTILPNAFAHQDKTQVPLVWQHGHNDPENILGHVMLENRDDGVYALGYFNKSAKAEHAHLALEHKDVNMMSIWANDLIERSKVVQHGKIREVSLVLAGANPGAIIENVTIRHAADDLETLEDEATIQSGEEIKILSHADNGGSGSSNGDDEETVADVVESMTDKQRDVLHYLVGEAIASSDSKDAEHGATGGDAITGSDATTEKKDDTDMSKTLAHNVFEGKDKDGKATEVVLSHDDMKAVVADAISTGSMKQAVENYVISHGITNLEVLFPEAKNLTQTPEWISRQMEWVAGVLGGTRKSPFSRIKSWTADITFDEARAKGYIKGSMKKEEYFSIASRKTSPTTIYKKQKLDRDDIIDITDFDVVTWMKGEMRLMLNEEIARAILVGDGREVDDPDKIADGSNNGEGIRPIATDDEFYTIRVDVNLGDADSSVLEVMDALLLNRQYYKGSGQPTLYTTENFIARLLLLREVDSNRRLYRTIDDVKTELRVAAIVPVEAMESQSDLLGVMVNLNDYVVGADRGGEVSMFDDFDIDYNQNKYLIETRISGALVKPKSALVIRSTASTDTSVVAVAPTRDGDEVTIPTVTGVEYVDYDTGDVLADASVITLDPGQTLRVQARAEATYYLAPGKTGWTYLQAPLPTGRDAIT